jgi:hypothetical protein
LTKKAKQVNKISLFWWLEKAAFARSDRCGDNVPFKKCRSGRSFGRWLVAAMDLVCEKYKKNLAAEGARCQHATEYCKFRTSCMIHFLGRESELAQGKEKDVADHESTPAQGEDHGSTAL